MLVMVMVMLNDGDGDVDGGNKCGTMCGRLSEILSLLIEV